MFSHIDDRNNPSMVDVSEKEATRRIAKAEAIVHVPSDLADRFANGELHGPKGPVFETARIAGVMAAKQTPNLIPLCHPVGIEDCQIEIDLDTDRRIRIVCTVVVTHKTGIEMEALTGATVAALTVYDMCKAVSHEILIERIRLLEKRGGKSDYVATD